MKRIINATLAVALVVALGAFFTHEASAQSKSTGKGERGALFIDKDGDGICDNFGTKSGRNLGNRFGMRGKGYGPGDGTGNKGVGPKDGTGFGPGIGVCDGSGPKGYRRGQK